MRTTFTNTIVDGGFRSNVIPGGAEATVNMRLLPGVTGEQAVRELRRAIDDPEVEVVVGTDDESADEVFKSVRERQRVAASSTKTDLYAALAREIRAQHRGAVVTPALYEASTEPARGGSAASRSTASVPTGPRPTDLLNMHGVDERVSITGLNQGTDMIERVCATWLRADVGAAPAISAIAAGPMPQQPPMPRAPRARQPATAAAGKPPTPAPRHACRPASHVRPLFG